MKYFLILTVLFFFSCNPNPSNSGQRISYYPDKKVKAIRSYKGEILDGPSFWFYPNGKMEQSTFYINGEAEGHAYFFFESGAIKSHRIMKKNKPVGYTENYFDHSIGLVQSIFMFNDSGQLIYRKIFDTTGKIIKEEGSLGK